MSAFEEARRRVANVRRTVTLPTVEEDRAGTWIADLRRDFPEFAGEVSVSKGWIWIVRAMAWHCHDEGATPRWTEVKSKYGELRVYGAGGGDVVDAYEELSRETCEVCGERGRTRSVGGWLETTCDVHARPGAEDDAEVW